MIKMRLLVFTSLKSIEGSMIISLIISRYKFYIHIKFKSID